MISFVILHYQAVDETVNCIETITRKVKGEKRIVVVDNCSPNGSGELLAEKYKNFSYINIILLVENLGFARGNNIGFKMAKKDDPDFIVVMNNDVIIKQNDFTDRVYSAFEDTQFDILGPDIFSTKKNNHQNPQRECNYTLYELESAKKRLQFKNLHKWMLRIKYLLPVIEDTSSKSKHYTSERKEDVVLHGACYIFSKLFTNNHEECFFNGTFMYYESYILHYLAQKERLRMIYEPSIKVIHHEDVATNLSYSNRYSKSIFVNKCLLDSCKVFIGLMKDDSIK